MMGDMHRGVMALEAPLCDVDGAGVHGFNPFGPYTHQQIPSVGIPCLGIPTMSWAATDPVLFSIEAQSSGKPPVSWQAESCSIQQSLGAHGTSGYNNAVAGQMEMMAALNASDHSYTGPSVNELSQMVQLYSSLYQADQYNEYSNLAPLDHPSSTSFPSEAQLHLIPSSSEVLQVVTNSSGSHDSLSETWRSSETSGECGPNYDTVLANLKESASVTLVMDHSSTHDSCSAKFQRLDILKLDPSVATFQLPAQESWIHHNQLQGAADHPGRSTNLPGPPPYNVLPVSSPSDPHPHPPPPPPPPLPPFKRPRTWDEALQQGSSESDHRLRYTLAGSRTSSLKLECSLNALSRPLPRTSTAQSPFQGRLATGAGYSSTARGLDHHLQEEGVRFLNGKPTATSVEPQSVAARHRRKKISERMRVLEKLIPGGNKMDTATMLDEAIEYVKFLQLQVQILENDSLDETTPDAMISSHPLTTMTSSAVKRKSMDRSCGISARSGGDFSAALSLTRAPATSPLVLSEVLQQQLFKQKLCLVSIRQCPPRTPPIALRKK